jgi:hypothetical protein
MKSRWPVVALLAIAIGGLALRLLSLFGPGGPLASPVGYDDGVYFSASALLVRGVLPYRDFVFVHPPGVTYFFALTSWWPEPAQGFAAARVLASVIGAINVFLAGFLVLRSAGPAGAIVAAFLYAVYPDAVIAERSPYLEPVLNFFCLLSAHCWLRERQRPFTAGVLVAAACAVKFWGGIWVLASLATARSWRDARRFLGGAIGAGFMLVAPLALTSLRGFVEQTLLFQVKRPVDGILEKSVRLREILLGGHVVATVLAAIAIVALLRWRTREQRYFTIAVLITVAGFVASSSYWNHYNSHLAASQCVLAGLAAAMLARIHRFAAVPMLLAVAIFQWQPLGHLWRGSRDRAGDMIASRAAILKTVPAGESVFAFDPAWSLAGNRLPPHGDGAPVVVDSYGAMLLQSVKSGKRFRDTGAALQSGVEQRDVRARLEHSRFAILGWRGNWQLGFNDRVWFNGNFLCVTPEAGDVCVWERTTTDLGAQLAVSPGDVAFGEGWYAEEGFPAWRWMAARSVTTLPAIATPARLQLHFWVPVASPGVVIELDGQRLDQFFATTSEVLKNYDIATPGPHTLVITTNRTLNPAKEGQSDDTRDLGLSLKRLLWMPIAEWPAPSGR